MKKLRYIGNVSKEQIQWGGNTDPRKILTKGKIYEVESEEVHSWHTKIFLKEFPNKPFNSVWFEKNNK